MRDIRVECLGTLGSLKSLAVETRWNGRSIGVTMPITTTQKNEIEAVIKTLLNATSPRIKRRLVDMFLELPDKASWPEYYQVSIPHLCSAARLLNGHHVIGDSGASLYQRCENGSGEEQIQGPIGRIYRLESCVLECTIL